MTNPDDHTMLSLQGLCLGERSLMHTKYRKCRFMLLWNFRKQDGYPICLITSSFHKVFKAPSIQDPQF